MRQNEVPVFDIQRFSIHDGPGIRTTVFFKGCNLDCRWCQNPESKSPVPVIAFYLDKCRQSFDCLKACTESAIRQEVEVSREPQRAEATIGKNNFRINVQRCNLCGFCVPACAYDALKVIGEYYTAAALLEKVKADMDYYRESGGGVTFSGGEPLLYEKFLADFLRLCRANQIHTLIQTAGVFHFENCQETLKLADQIYFDLKLFDPAAHKEYTGKENAVILKNAGALVANGVSVEFRIPLIPGITDTRENLFAYRQFLSELKIDRLHLMKYHGMGESKIDIIQSSQKKMGLASYTGEQFQQAVTFFESQGFQVINNRVYLSGSL